MPNQCKAGKFLITSLLVTCGLALAIYKHNTDAIARLAHKEQTDILNISRSSYQQYEDKLFKSIFRHLLLAQTAQEAETLLSSTKRIRPSDHMENAKLKQKSDKIFQHDIDVESISLLTNGGINILSTDFSLIGRYQPLENTATLIDPLRSEEFSLTFLMDPILNKPALYVVLPIRNNIGKRIGYYGLNLNTKSIHQSITESANISDLNPPASVRAVSYTTANKITEIYEPNSTARYRPMKSKAIINGFNNMNERYLYLDHLKRPTVGAYALIDSANMVVLVERQQSILFKREVERLRQVLAIGMLISFALFIILTKHKSHSEGAPT
jgi:hypothetical protein